MIPLPLDRVGPSDIDALLANQVPEGRSVEYKRDLPGGGDAEKKEFLADVSSFANTAGGDLIFGIHEVGGVPTQIFGVSTNDMDAEQRRIDSMIRDGLEPRISYALRPIQASNGKVVLILRIDQSFEAPHRVIFKQHDRFYARSSVGKYPLDTGELRQAFAKTGNTEASIIRFRDERLLEISTERTPLPLDGPGRLVMHLLPLESFSGRRRISMSALQEVQHQLVPMNTSGWNNRITLNGILTYSPGSPKASSYTHLYRSGILEAVDGFMLNYRPNGERTLPSIAFEERLINSCKTYIEIQRKLGVQPPIYCFISILGAKGVKLGVGNSMWGVGDPVMLEEEVIPFPEAIVTSFGVSVDQLLREPFDMIWNAFGYAKSYNYADDGSRKPR